MASSLYESSKTAHYNKACPSFVFKDHKPNVCEHIISGNSSFVFMIKNHPENGITVELHKVVMKKLKLISSKDGLGEFLVFVNRKNLFIVDDFGDDGMIDIVFRVASQPQEMIVGFSLNSKLGKLENLISRKIDLGSGKFTTSEFIVVYPADKLKVLGNELRIESGVHGKSIYKYSKGKFHN